MDGLNWYAYAGGNPINFADPTGYGAQKVLGAMNSGLNALGMVANSFLNLIPGQAAWQNSVASAQSGNYGQAAAHFGIMAAEQVLTVASLGTSASVGAVSRAGSTAVTAARVEAAVVGGGTGQLAQTEFAFARGASIQTPGVTHAGEVFVRVGATEASTAVRAGGYAMPEATFNALGRNPAVLKDALDLPGSAPQFFRYIRPPAGTSIQRGTVPGGEFGGVGGHPEVIFPRGVN
jgi:hypothetical protein